MFSALYISWQNLRSIVANIADYFIGSAHDDFYSSECGCVLLLMD
jgi:hypothetical protein